MVKNFRTLKSLTKSKYLTPKELYLKCVVLMNQLKQQKIDFSIKETKK